MTGLTELVKLGKEHPEVAFAKDRLEEIAQNKQKYKNKQGGGGGSGGKSFGHIQPSFGTPRIVNRPATPFYESANREIEFFQQQQQQAINQPAQQQGFTQHHQGFNQPPQQVFNQPPQQAFNQPSQQQVFNRAAQPRYSQAQQGQAHAQGFNQPPQYQPQSFFQQAGLVAQAPSNPVNEWLDMLDIPPPRTPSPMVLESDWSRQKCDNEVNVIAGHVEAELAKYDLVQFPINSFLKLSNFKSRSILK